MKALRLRRRALPALAAAFASAGRAASPAGPAPLQVALAPFLSPAALLATFRPLREHLEASLQRPVQLVSARDFRALAEATRRGEHAVAQMPAHLARLAMLDWGWRMLAAPEHMVTVEVVVRSGGPVQAPADLRGRRVGLLDPLSLTATVGRRWLQTQGLEAAVRVLVQPSVNSALYALDRDEIVAFVCADSQRAGLPPSTPQQGAAVLARIGGIPGPTFIARPDLPAAEVEALRAALRDFRPDPARPMTAANSRLRPLETATLARLDEHVALARAALAAR
jgi:phosphonate transport system substrate-binding protein